MAALKGHLEAQINLAICYSEGLGTVQNHDEALKWYREASERNHPAAQFNIGLCYLHGFEAE